MVDGDQQAEHRMARANKSDLGDYDKGVTLKQVGYILAFSAALAAMVWSMYKFGPDQTPAKSGYFLERQVPNQGMTRGIGELETNIAAYQGMQSKPNANISYRI